MRLGRNERLHLSCSFSGREKDCPKDCSRCAITIKNDADTALSKCVKSNAAHDPNLGEAIKLYKKALFIEPNYADAWCSLAEAFKTKHEYNNAISAFDKALSIDPQYGEAMFGKARVLEHQGKLYAALEVYDDILSLYEDGTVNNRKWLLEKAGIRDGTVRYSLQEAKDALTEKTLEILASYDLLDKYGQNSIGGLDKKEACAGYIYSYWKRSIYDLHKHGSGGMQMVWRHTLTDAFYGAIFITLNYYIKIDKFTDDPFEYLCSHEKDNTLRRNAEEMMGIRGINAQTRELFNELWIAICSYISYSKTILGGIEPSSDLDAAVRNAAENAYVLGALFAVRQNEQIKQIDKRPLEENAVGRSARPDELDECKDSGQSLPPVLPPFHPRKLSYYGLLEPIEVLHENASADISDVSSHIIAETTDYFVYSYQRKSDRKKYLIRQSKRNRNEIVYFGYEPDSVCFFNGQLFFITHGFAGGDGIASIDINSGQRSSDEYKWFSERTVVFVDVGVNQDIVKSLHVENGNLIIDVSRVGSSYQKKGDLEDLFDVSMDYKLSVRVENGKYVLTRLYTNIDTSLLKIIADTSIHKWRVATANNLYFLIDKDNKIAKTRNGYVLQTSSLDLANRMRTDLEKYGDVSISDSMLCLDLESVSGRTPLKADNSSERNESKISYHLENAQSSSFCTNCGKLLRDDMLFCPYCGSKRV